MKTLHIQILTVALIGIVITIALAISARQSQDAQFYLEFKKYVDERAAYLDLELRNNLEVLHSIKGLFDASDNVTREEFKNFATSVLKRHDDIQALEWIPLVAHADREQLEALARRDGLENFEIRERQDGGIMERAKQRENYYPVYYLEPFKGNEAALGFDLGSSPSRLAAIIKARDSDEVIASEGITLVQEKGKQKGVLLFLSIYKGNAKSVADRRKNLLGFALGVFRIGDIVESAIEKIHVKGLGIDFKLVDVSSDGEINVLHHHTPRSGQQIVSGWEYQRRLHDIGGRSWRVEANPTPRLVNAHKSVYPIAIFIVGLLFTSLLTAYIYILMMRAGHVRELVNIRTTEVEEAKRELLKNNAELTKTLNELAQFNKHAMDRELRMIDLKKEINELSIKLGNDPPYNVSFAEDQKRDENV
jgi:CHASE1-domain containing sensor protein